MISLLEAVKKHELKLKGENISRFPFLVIKNVKDTELLVIQNVKNTGLEHPKKTTLGERCIVRSFVKRKERKYVLVYENSLSKELNEDEFKHHLDVLNDCCIPLDVRINMEAIFTNAKLRDCQYLARNFTKHQKCVVIDEHTISIAMNPFQALNLLPNIPLALYLGTYKEIVASNHEEDIRIELMHRITPTVMSLRILD